MSGARAFPCLVVVLFLVVRVSADEGIATGTSMDAQNETAVLERRMQAAFRDMHARRLDAAEAGFRAILQRYPDHSEAQFGLGAALFESGQAAEAIAVLEQLYESTPDYYPVLNNLAWFYATTTELHLRDGARSVRLSQEAIFRQPRRFQIWNTLAEAYFITGDYERSERSARQALRYAREQGAPPALLERYRVQAERARTARRAAEIFEREPHEIRLLAQ